MPEMTVEHLHQMHEQHPDEPGFDFDGNCRDCGTPVLVSVELTDRGFRITGGAAYVRGSGPHPTDLKCDACFQKDPHLGGDCEIYSRVVGYLRPVKNWNDAQQAQFRNRKLFDGSIA